MYSQINPKKKLLSLIQQNDNDNENEPKTIIDYKYLSFRLNSKNSFELVYDCFVSDNVAISILCFDSDNFECFNSEANLSILESFKNDKPLFEFYFKGFCSQFFASQNIHKNGFLIDSITIFDVTQYFLSYLYTSQKYREVCKI